MSERYQKSERLLARAEKVIPLGSQTFSKSKTQYPFGVSPFFIERGQGSRVWDVDGNEYIDFVNSLAAVTLGHNDPDVTQAVRLQLENGVIFPLPHPLEVDVAEAICEMVPCADMVRYGKNGSDATSGAIRLARAYTRRDHVAVCGYHGWQDWYIGSTLRNRGVPEATQRLTHPFIYNDLSSLESIFKDYPDQLAAVMLEPMNIAEPKAGFLESVQDLARRKGAVFIFDETITGFRFANGGAGQYFNITPDLATFGKGVANGYPLSVVAGKGDIMKLMEEIFFSFTFGGETLSLAAAKATLSKLKRQDVVSTLTQRGRSIIDGVLAIIQKLRLENSLSISGHPTWSFLTFKDSGGYSNWQLKTYFLQEMFAQGILALGTHNLSFAHSQSDIDRLLSVYGNVFSLLKETLDKKDLDKRLKCPPLEPLFKLR